MSEEREFDLGDILSITTDRLLSPRGMSGVGDILSFMAGEAVFTHQLPRISREAAPVLLRRHPQLASVDASSVTRENWETFLADQMVRFGQRLPVPKLSTDEHERIDPMSELAEKMHPDNIIVVDAQQPTRARLDPPMEFGE